MKKLRVLKLSTHITLVNIHVRITRVQFILSFQLINLMNLQILNGCRIEAESPVKVL